MPSLVCEAVLFDLDGVLVDSTPCVSRIWSQWAREHGLDPDYVVHVAHGQRTIESVRTVAPHLDAAYEAKQVEDREIEDTEGLRVLPGAKELLTSLPPGRFTIVTSGTRALATKRLQVARLPVPLNMVTADDVSRGKPDPEPYLKGAAILGVNANQCVVFEDAPSGIRSALAAGATAIAIPTTYRPDELTAAALILPSLAAVTATLSPKNSSILLDLDPDHIPQSRK